MRPALQVAKRKQYKRLSLLVEVRQTAVVPVRCVQAESSSLSLDFVVHWTYLDSLSLSYLFLSSSKKKVVCGGDGGWFNSVLCETTVGGCDYAMRRVEHVVHKDSRLLLCTRDRL